MNLPNSQAKGHSKSTSFSPRNTFLLQKLVLCLFWGGKIMLVAQGKPRAGH